MGLFKRNRQDAETADEDGPLTPVEGLTAIAVCAVYADGVLSADEDAELAGYLSRMRIFRTLSDRHVEDMLRKVHQLAVRHGDETLLQRSCETLPTNLRPTAYLLATDLLMSDDEFGDDEQHFLQDLQRRLALDDPTAARIRDVLAIKHET